MTLSCIHLLVTLLFFCAAPRQLFQYFTLLRSNLYFVLILPVIFLMFLQYFLLFTGILKSFCFFARNVLNFPLTFYIYFQFLRSFLEISCFFTVILPVPHSPYLTAPLRPQKSPLSHLTAPLRPPTRPQSRHNLDSTHKTGSPSKFCYKPQNSLVSFSAAYGIMEIS